MSVNAHNERKVPEFLTIEEAAERLGVSVATARRRAAVGEIPATKSGRQWVVDGSKLPSRPRRRATPARPAFDLERALVHVRRIDFSEASVPDVLRFQDQIDDESGALAGAERRLQDGPGPYVEVEVDKDALFTRRTILIDVEDRVAYQAAVAALAQRIESQTSDAVFSARLSKDPRYFLQRAIDLWLKWRRAVLGQLGPDQEWMVATDLTSFFDTISHRSLLAEIESLNVDPEIVSAIRAMLADWSPTEGFGLPQGPNASRLLANLYLLPVDRAMLDEGWCYSRYLDDVRIVTKSRDDGVRALRQFQTECRRRGLIVSSAKTKFLHGEEALQSLLSEEDLATADYLLESNSTNLARKQLKAILKRALKREAHLDSRRAKFSLYRLTKLREGGVVGRVLKRLEDLAPIASIVAQYLQPFISRRSVVRELGQFLADPTRSYSTHMVAWLLAAMLEHPGNLPPQWVKEASKRLKDQNEPVYLRAIAAIVVARGGRSADIAWIKKDLQREHDPMVLRGYAVGLHWAHALGKQTQRQLVARSPQLAKTVAYLQGRSTLPSLIYSERTLTVPGK